MSIQVSGIVRNAAYALLAQSGALIRKGNVIVFPAWETVLNTMLTIPHPDQKYNGLSVQSSYDAQTDGSVEEWKENRNNGCGLSMIGDAVDAYLDYSEFGVDGRTVSGRDYVKTRKIRVDNVKDSAALDALIGKLESSPDRIKSGMIWKLPEGCKPGLTGKRKPRAPNLFDMLPDSNAPEAPDDDNDPPAPAPKGKGKSK